MKIVKNIFLVIFLTVVNVLSVFADAPPATMPVPGETAKIQADGTPTAPVPIDQNLMFLLVLALLFGVYTIYRYNLKRKASM